MSKIKEITFKQSLILTILLLILGALLLIIGMKVPATDPNGTSLSVSKFLSMNKQDNLFDLLKLQELAVKNAGNQVTPMDMTFLHLLRTSVAGFSFIIMGLASSVGTTWLKIKFFL